MKRDEPTARRRALVSTLWKMHPWRTVRSPNYDDVIVREFGEQGKYLQRRVAGGRRDFG